MRLLEKTKREIRALVGSYICNYNSEPWKKLNNFQEVAFFLREMFNHEKWIPSISLRKISEPHQGNESEIKIEFKIPIISRDLNNIFGPEKIGSILEMPFVLNINKNYAEIDLGYLSLFAEYGPLSSTLRSHSSLIEVAKVKDVLIVNSDTAIVVFKNGNDGKDELVVFFGAQKKNFYYHNVRLSSKSPEISDKSQDSDKIYLKLYFKDYSDEEGELNFTFYLFGNEDIRIVPEKDVRRYTKMCINGIANNLKSNASNWMSLVSLID